MHRSRAGSAAADLPAVLPGLSLALNVAAQRPSVARASAKEKRTASDAFAAGVASYDAGDLAKGNVVLSAVALVARGTSAARQESGQGFWLPQWIRFANSQCRLRALGNCGPGEARKRTAQSLTERTPSRTLC